MMMEYDRKQDFYSSITTKEIIYQNQDTLNLLTNMHHFLPHHLAHILWYSKIMWARGIVLTTSTQSSEMVSAWLTQPTHLGRKVAATYQDAKIAFLPKQFSLMTNSMIINQTSLMPTLFFCHITSLEVANENFEPNQDE